MKIRLLLILLLFIPLASSSSPMGIFSAQDSWSGVSVRASLTVELYAENYEENASGTAAQWYDFTNRNVFASMSNHLKKPSLKSNYLDFDVGDYLKIASFAYPLESNLNHIIAVYRIRDNAASRNAGAGPMAMSFNPGNIYFELENTQSIGGRTSIYSGSYVSLSGANSFIASDGLRFAAASFGTAGRNRINYSGTASASSGALTTSTGCQIGGNSNGSAYMIDGDVYAVLIYNRQLATDEVQLVFDELANHYGLSIPSPTTLAPIVTVRDGIQLEFLSENYVIGDANKAAFWHDAINPALALTQATVASMPTLTGNYIDMPLRSWLKGVVLSPGLASSANSFIMVAEQRDNPLSSVGGYGPAFLTGNAASAQDLLMWRGTTRKLMSQYATPIFTSDTETATASLRFMYSSVGTYGQVRHNNQDLATGTSGTGGSYPITTLIVGARNAGTYCFDGKVYALIVYNRQLSDAEITTVFNELASHYGLTIP